METDNAEAKKVLLGQARVLGMEVDGRWSVDTLAMKVQEAQEAQKEANTKAIKDASDTWVYLLRDAFPAEDEKHRAGETIKVPADMADRWYEAGVARPGKEPTE
jgi:hypothetical protein